MDYQEAREAMVTREEAKAEIAAHHLDWEDFVEEYGDLDEYLGEDVLNWLGY